MTVKTYGVPGLSEWHGKLKVGTIEVNVSFIGGTASPSGAQPASMTTKDPIVQFVVENSKEWKQGMIILLQKQDVAGVHPRMAVKTAENHAQDDMNQLTEEKDTKGSNKASGSETDESGKGTTFVKVADKADAVEWLKENYPDKGYTANKLRSEAAFTAACQECGVTFEFVK